MRLSIASVVACAMATVAIADQSQATAKNLPTNGVEGGVGQGVGPQKAPVSLPAQDLSSALQTFANDRKLYLIYAQDDVLKHRTTGATGELTADETLNRLLKDTGLTYRYLDDKTITIVPIASAPANDKKSLTSLRKTSWAGNDKSASRLAQNENPNSTSASSADESESSSSVKLEEIVVTAQKREERLIDTPISIGVLSGENLDRSSSRSVADVLNQVGGVTVTEDQPGQVNIAVRGVVPGAGTSTTAYYLDEAPFSFVRFSNLPDSNAFDLARVEVLRGPQGTLYGASAMSGVVRVLTHDANLDAYEAKGRFRGSNTEGAAGNYGGDLAVNVPLIRGKLAVRGVVGYSDLSGFIDSRFDGQTRINDTQAQSYRVKMNYQPTENLNLKFGYTRSEIDNVAPSSASDDFTTPFSSDRRTKLVMDMYSLVASYRWERMSLLSATSYIDYATDSRDEFLLSGTSRAVLLSAIPVESFSQELRLVSALEGPWQWSAGAIYKDTTDTEFAEARDFFPSPFEVDENSQSWAVFGEATRSFDDGRYAITGGLRYFEDRVIAVDKQDLLGGPLLADRKAEYDQVTGRLVFTYKPQEDSVFYGSAATGFRSGQHQGSGVIRVEPSFGPAVEDTLITYELGTKGRLLNGAITYDSAVYYTEWDDIQQNLILPIGFRAITNAGAASGVGVDAGLSYQPTRAFALHASIGWNDLTFDENVLSAGTVLFEKGVRVNNSPEWTGSVGADYRRATPKSGVDFVASGNFAYGSERSLWFLTAGDVRTTQSQAMRLLKASVGLAGDRWSLDIYGDNLLNDDNAITPPDINAANAALRLRPRTIGLQAAFNF